MKKKSQIGLLYAYNFWNAMLEKGKFVIFISKSKKSIFNLIENLKKINSYINFELIYANFNLKCDENCQNCRFLQNQLLIDANFNFKTI